MPKDNSIKKVIVNPRRGYPRLIVFVSGTRLRIKCTYFMHLIVKPDPGKVM